MFSKQFLIWILVFSCASPIILSAQTLVFSTQLSANKIGLEDQLNVSFVLQNARNISNFKPPTFSGFEVLAGPIQSSQTNISFVNGKARRNSTLRLTYRLKPINKGIVKIQGATVDIDGKTYSSNPATIQIVAGSLMAKQSNRRQNINDPFANNQALQAMRQQQRKMQQFMQQQMQQMQQQARQSSPGRVNSIDLSTLDKKHLNDNVFIKVTVDNKHPFEGQQINVSYKLYTRLPMNMSLTQLPSLDGFWSEDFDIPNPPKPKIEKIDGKEFQVFLLKKTALFPQRPGKLILDPAKAEGVVRIIEKNKKQSPLVNDPSFGSLFMNDPFFHNRSFSRYQYKDVRTHLSSKSIAIHVKPLPAKERPKSFTGAVGQFSIHASIDSTILFTGNSANFTLTLKGHGNFKLIGNPKITLPTSLNALSPLVADSIIDRSPKITGEKTFTFNLSPQHPGEYTIPAVVFTYFDPKADKYKTIHTQTVKITVKQGTETLITKSNANSSPTDIHAIIKQKQNWQMHSFLFVVTPWYWLLYLIALLVFGVVWYLYRQKRNKEANVVFWRHKKANKVAWKRLAVARKVLGQEKAHTKFYEEISKAIWLYLSDKLNIPISNLSKEKIAGNLRQNMVSDDLINGIHIALSECEMALYSPSGGQQKREQTLEKAYALIGELEDSLQKRKK